MRRHQRGFTLIELMISIVIGAIVVLGAIAVASHQVRALGTSSQALEINQVGRVVLEMIADDITNAGVGVGYRIDNDQYEGLPPFGVGSALSAAGRVNALPVGSVTTQDLLVAVADGATATIVAMNGAGDGFLICAGADGEPRFNTANEGVILRDAFGLVARSARMTVNNPRTSCPTADTCRAGEAAAPSEGCMDVTISEDFAWGTDADALDLGKAPLSTFLEGSVTGNFRQVAWYVEPTNGGTLRRTTDPLCYNGGVLGCGDIAAEGVEALAFQIFQLRAGTNNIWDPVAAPITTFQPLRIDLELAMRGRTDDIENVNHDAAQLRLTGACIPTGCAQTTVRREVFRTSVEIKNSGYMRVNGGST